MTTEHKKKYHKTAQFRSVYKTMKDRVQWVSEGESGHYDNTLPIGTHTFIGSVKLHGTNARMVVEDDDVTFLSNKGIELATLKEGSTFEQLSGDNCGFAATVGISDRDDLWKFIDHIKLVISTHHNNAPTNFTIAGEWVGQGVQKGVGISELPKTFYFYGVKLDDGWMSPLLLNDVLEVGIFKNLWKHKTFEVDIDFDNPEEAKNVMSTITLDVEKECPIAKEFGMSGIGEGVVWTPKDPSLHKDTGLWFKVKGEKHSVSKVKTLVSICPEKMNSITEFLEYCVTDNRVSQGASEVGLDVKNTGKFIGWFLKDIIAEESDVIVASGLTLDEVKPHLVKLCSKKFRELL